MHIKNNKNRVVFLVRVAAFKDIYIWIPISWELTIKEKDFLIYHYEVENKARNKKGSILIDLIYENVGFQIHKRSLSFFYKWMQIMKCRTDSQDFK
jgi:hypothetical protein